MADELSTEPVVEATDAVESETDADNAFDSVTEELEGDLSENLESEDVTDEADEEEEEESDEPDSPEEESTDESEESDTEEAEEETQQDSEELDIKERNRQAAEQRIREKQQREQEIRDQQEQYVAEADPDDPRDAAVRQLQVDAYNTKVERLTNTLTGSYQRAVQDFPILNSTDPVVRAEVDAALDLFERGYIEMDPYQNPKDVRGDLYQFLQSKADSIEKLTGIGARQQEKNKSKEKSKTVTAPNRAPKPEKKDADLEAFYEEARKYD